MFFQPFRWAGRTSPFAVACPHSWLEWCFVEPPTCSPHYCIETRCLLVCMQLPAAFKRESVFLHRSCPSVVPSLLSPAGSIGARGEFLCPSTRPELAKIYTLFFSSSFFILLLSSTVPFLLQANFLCCPLLATFSHLRFIFARLRKTCQQPAMSALCQE